MISGDPGALDPNTETGKRMAEYRQVFGEIDILLAYGNVWSFISGFFRWLKILSQKKHDVITAQSPEHYLLAWIFSKVSGAPWQMQIHTDIFSPYFWRESFKNKIRVALVKFLLKHANCIRVVSERIKNSIFGTSDVPKDIRCPVIVLPIFVDTEKIRQAPIKTDLHKKYHGRFIILMASRITREKNIELALEALASLISAEGGQARLPAYGGNERMVLLVVGDGPELPKLKFQVSSFKLQDYVVFEPHADDLISYYKTCDLFLLASNYEGYGRTLVEAAVAGAKIVSSDVGIAQEVLEPEAIFRVWDKEDLKSKITAALRGNLPPPKLVASQTKEEYLKLYKRSFEVCLI